MNLDKIRAALGITEEMSEGTAEALILARAEKMTSELATRTTELADATAALAKAEEGAEALRLSRGKPAKVDPALIDLVGDNRSMKIDALQSAGKITKVAADQMKADFISGTEGLSLSDSLARDSGKSDGFDKLVSILQANDNVIDLTELSGAQLLLSQQKQKPEEASLVTDAKGRTKE